MNYSLVTTQHKKQDEVIQEVEELQETDKPYHNKSLWSECVNQLDISDDLLREILDAYETRKDKNVYHEEIDDNEMPVSQNGVPFDMISDFIDTTSRKTSFEYEDYPLLQ